VDTNLIIINTIYNINSININSININNSINSIVITSRSSRQC